MATKLKPCPFCGGDVERFASIDGYGVWCVECKISVVTAYRDESVRLWNARNTAPLPAAERRVVEAAVRHHKAKHALRLSAVMPTLSLNLDNSAAEHIADRTLAMAVTALLRLREKGAK